jgi:general secretion pathway protein A
MYLNYYGLTEPPFAITPDPRFVYLSERHRDALAHLLYGVGQGGGGGFVQLTGEIGTGKTTLCRLLLEQLPEKTRVALILNPKLAPIELLESLAEELGLKTDDIRGSQKSLTDRLNAYLLEAYADGWRIVLIIDEAQTLSIESLEQIRLLTNLETSTQKLLQIILLGQPELRELLGRPELVQLAQRITARYHLTPLSADETELYVRHRLSVAGCERQPFSKLGLRALHKRSAGIPRLINVIADRALVAGYAHSLERIGEKVVNEAADEALIGGVRPGWRRPWPWLALLVALALAAAWWWWPEEPVVEPPAPPPAPTMARLDGPSLQGALASADAASGWQQLMQLWQLPAETPPQLQAGCPVGLSAEWLCFRGSGSFAKLRLFGRPVLLVLRDGNRVVPVLLTAMDREQAQLELPGASAVVDRNVLREFWSGEYRALNRLPAGFPATLRLSDQGPAVQWVREQLDRALGEEAPLSGEAVDLFDATIERRVRRLQEKHGLLADGIVGPETWFALACYVDEGPRLGRPGD